MTKRALAKVLLDTAVQFERIDIPQSTLIPNGEWYYEAEFTAGRIADIHCYQRKRSTDGSPPVWKWIGAIPASRVKGYSWVDADIPTNLLVPKIANAESEAAAVEGDDAGARKPAAAAPLRS